MALLREDETQEFERERIEGRAGLFVHIHEQEAGEGILAAYAILVGGFDEVILILAERERMDIGGPVADARVADRAEVRGNALDDGERAWLLLHGRLEVALLERLVLEKPVGAGGAVAAEKGNRLRRPIASEAELAPGGNVLRTAFARAV